MSDDQNTVDGLELINCIASGTHSQIWEVGEPGGSQHFAMKLLVPEAMGEKENIAVLKHEAKVQKSLVHPNFIPFHRVIANKQHAYVLMDFCRSPNVKVQLMTDVMGLQVRAPKLIEGLCVALAFMHDKGWLHRDIKPENVLFNKSGELKLIDFSLSLRHSSGIGKMFGGAPKTIQGTRTYIAPETILKKAPSPQTDMYSLGIMLFEVLAGQRPFTAPTPDILLNKHLKEASPAPSEFNKNVTPEADAFILRMLSKKPAKRHANMNELLAEFRSLKLFKKDINELKTQADQKQKEIDEAGGDLSKAWTLDSRQDAIRTEKGIAPPVKPVKKKKAPPKPPVESPSKQPEAAPTPQPPPVGMQPQQPPPGMAPQFAPPGYFPPGMYPPPPGMYPPPPGQPGAPAYPMPPQQQVPPGAYPPGYPQMPPNGPPDQQPPMPAAQQPAQPPPGQAPPQQPPAQQQAPPPPAQAPAAGPNPVAPQSAADPQEPPVAPQEQSQPAPPVTASPQPARQAAPGVDKISRDEAELRPQAPITAERHLSQTEDDGDLPLMEELPDIL